MKKIITYLFIIIVAAYCLRVFVYVGLRHNERGIFDKFNIMFLKKNTYETVIIGSSRAESHFNCGIIDSALHTNSYNLGIAGASLPFTVDIFNAYLEKSTFPKNVILNVDFHINRCDNDTVFMFPRYFPYLQNKTLYNALEKRDKRFAGFKYFPFYGLAYMGDNYLAAALRGYFNKPGKYDLDYYKGYTSLQPVKWIYKPYSACDDDAVFNKLDTLAHLCKMHNARLYIILSPMYYKGSDQVLNKDIVIQKIKNKAAQNQLIYLDYSTDSMCKDFSFFADPYHMNKSGSTLFTGKLTKDLGPYFH